MAPGVTGMQRDASIATVLEIGMESTIDCRLNGHPDSGLIHRIPIWVHDVAPWRMGGHAQFQQWSSDVYRSSAYDARGTGFSIPSTAPNNRFFKRGESHIRPGAWWCGVLIFRSWPLPPVLSYLSLPAGKKEMLAEGNFA